MLLDWAFSFLFLRRAISALKAFCQPGDLVKDCPLHMSGGVGTVTEIPPPHDSPQVICVTISAGWTNLVACWNLGGNCLGQALFSFLIPSAKQWWLTLIFQIPNSGRKWALVFPTRLEMQLSHYFLFPEVSLFFFCVQEPALCSVITHLQHQQPTKYTNNFSHKPSSAYETSQQETRSMHSMSNKFSGQTTESSGPWLVYQAECHGLYWDHLKQISFTCCQSVLVVVIPRSP